MAVSNQPPSAGRRLGRELSPLRDASSSRPEGVAPLDGEPSRRLDRRTLLLHLAKQWPRRSGVALPLVRFEMAGQASVRPRRDEFRHSYATNTEDTGVSVINGATCDARRRTGCAQTLRRLSVGDYSASIATDPTASTAYVQDSEGVCSHQARPMTALGRPRRCQVATAATAAPPALRIRPH